MNYANEITRLKQKYSTSHETSVCLQEAFKVFSSFTKALVDQLNKPKGTQLEILSEHAKQIEKLYKYILSNPQATPEEITETKIIIAAHTEAISVYMEATSES